MLRRRLVTPYRQESQEEGEPGQLADGQAWTRTLLDATLMGASGCAAADLNADRRVDLACISSATANLKWYENLGPGGSP
jgi:hypothetical protein